MIGKRFKAEILKKSKENDSKLILALDVRDAEKSLKLAKETARYLAGIKIGIPLVLVAGLGIISRIKEATGMPIVADFKIADAPHVSRSIASSAYDAGADAVIAHSFVGRDALEAVIEAAKEKGDGGVIVVPSMSHPGAAEFIKPISERMARLAVEVGATGVIGPATRPAEIGPLRSWVGEELLILAPGVGPQGARPGDAIGKGADFEIVGRSVYASENPAEAAKEISRRVSERSS